MDQHYLLEALSLAQSQRGHCAPNPPVGAIVVKHDKLLAKGYHMGPGTDHAERQALKQLDAAKTNQATLYVTLEPCCHYGRTPPCTDIIIQSGISRVVIGAVDPNPQVSYQGIQQLRDAEIECEYIKTEAIDQFYESYRHWQATGLPFVTTKLAMTLDGKIADHNGCPIPITSERANQLTHEQRYYADAILTTSQTIIADNPKLNARTHSETQPKNLYILDTHLRTPPEAAIFDHAQSTTIFYHHNETTSAKTQLFADKSLIHLDKRGQNGLELEQVMRAIGHHGVHDLWVEAGGVLLSALINQSWANRSLLYIAPHWLGAGQAAFNQPLAFDKASHINWSDLAPDGLCTISWSDSNVHGYC